MQEKDFFTLCSRMLKDLTAEWDVRQNLLNEVNLKLKETLQGRPEAEQYFKDMVTNYLAENEVHDCKYPSYYIDLVSGIYDELWGFAGVSEWFTPRYAESSSAKIIGDRIYFLDGGQMRLMPQRINTVRRAQLITKLLTANPAERRDKDFHEVYLMDGTRITIYNESMCKAGQDCIIFRRYTVPTYSFNEQAKRGTISYDMIPLFMSMVRLGYNVAFTGAVRTAKTTFLATWQSYEDPTLEGVLVETDPEIPLHKMMPDAPIIQTIADGDKLRQICKRLKRSDADYIIMAEARDGTALDTAIEIANSGTRRCKMTFHNRDPRSFVYDVANKIVKSEGGDLKNISENVAQSVDYIFHFIQLKDKSQKRLSSIHEIYFDKASRQIIITELCQYVKETDSWRYRYAISGEKEIAGRFEDEGAFEQFQEQLKTLAELAPVNGNGVYSISYQ